MSSYKNYFDSITPRTSDREFAGKVISRAAKPGRLCRTAVSVSAAAAALTVFAVTASALCQWDIAAAVSSFFGDNGSFTEQHTVDIAVRNETNTFGGIDITASGAVRDKNFTVVFLDLQRTDGGIFDCAPYIESDSEGNELIFPDGNLRSDIPRYSFGEKTAMLSCADKNETFSDSRISCYTVADENDSDGHITQAVCIDTSSCSPESIKLDLCGLTGSKVTGRYSEDKRHIYAFDSDILEMSGSYCCEIDLGGCLTPDLEINAGITASVKCYPCTNDPDELTENSRCFDFRVNRLSLTPVSVSIELERDIPDETYYVERYPYLGSVLTKDGKELPFGGYELPSAGVNESGNIRHLPLYPQEDSWTFSGSFILPQSADIDDIAAVKIGDTVFGITP